MTIAVPQRAWVEQIMGLPVSIHLRGDQLTGDVEQRIAAVFADLRHVDEVLSPYRDSNDLSAWELGALRLADADPRTGEPCYDPSGLVKGWAVERAARHLDALDGYGWCLNAGGDVLVHAPADQPAWQIGIEHPDDPARIMRVVECRTGAVATSGSAPRGAHIIDPRTRRPTTAVRAVTSSAPTLLWADVYATAAAAQGSASLPWLDFLAGYDALLVTRAGLVRTTGS